MKLGSIINIGLFIVAALLFLIQLWFSVWSPDVFIKILITMVVLLGVSLVLTFLMKEADETKRIKEGRDL